ncbi:MAG: hypothetical protein RR585_10930 [Coprobacillus sp.]
MLKEGSQIMSQSVKQKRTNYVKKVIKEFKRNGWNNHDTDYRGVSSILNNSSIDKIASNKKSYENFKDRVSKSRKYNKERSKVHTDYSKIQSRYEENKVKRNTQIAENVRQAFEGKGASPQATKHAIVTATQIGIKSVQRSFEEIQQEFKNNFLERLTNQITLDGKQSHGVFKNQSETEIVKKMVNDIDKEIGKSPNFSMMASALESYLYEDLIYAYYKDDDRENSEYKKADTQFWLEITHQMVNKAKELNNRRM